jgi:hypothetical protein
MKLWRRVELLIAFDAGGNLLVTVAKDFVVAISTSLLVDAALVYSVVIAANEALGVRNNVVPFIVAGNVYED